MAAGDKKPARARPTILAAQPPVFTSPPVVAVPFATPAAEFAEATAVPPVADPVPPINAEEVTMNDSFNTASDALKNGAEQIKSTLAGQTENAIAQGKASFEQVSAKSREAFEHGIKSIDEAATHARGNVEALLASSRAASQGIESIAREVAEFSRKSFEETTAAARAMTTVKTPNELLQLQNDFAKSQFDASVAELSKLSETFVKLLGEVFEPIQARATIATDKIKDSFGSLGR